VHCLGQHDHSSLSACLNEQIKDGPDSREHQASKPFSLHYF
jgi:hypothetical protein